MSRRTLAEEVEEFNAAVDEALRQLARVARDLILAITVRR